MQNISLNKCPTNIIENKVLQNIAECDINDDEVVTLQQQITELNKTIVNLEDAIQIKDTQLENTHREKGRLLAELKKQQRCNRNLKRRKTTSLKKCNGIGLNILVTCQSFSNNSIRN